MVLLDKANRLDHQDVNVCHPYIVNNLTFVLPQCWYSMFLYITLPTTKNRAAPGLDCRQYLIGWPKYNIAAKCRLKFIKTPYIYSDFQIYLTRPPSSLLCNPPPGPILDCNPQGLQSVVGTLPI